MTNTNPTLALSTLYTTSRWVHIDDKMRLVFKDFPLYTQLSVGDMLQTYGVVNTLHFIRKFDYNDISIRRVVVGAFLPIIMRYINKYISHDIAESLLEITESWIQGDDSVNMINDPLYKRLLDLYKKTTVLLERTTLRMTINYMHACMSVEPESSLYNSGTLLIRILEKCILTAVLERFDNLDITTIMMSPNSVVDNIIATELSIITPTLMVKLPQDLTYNDTIALAFNQDIDYMKAIILEVWNIYHHTVSVVSST